MASEKKKDEHQEHQMPLLSGEEDDTETKEELASFPNDLPNVVNVNSKAKHNRTVSWDLVSGEKGDVLRHRTATDGEFSQVTHPESTRSKISLRDLVKMSPLESEAETYIQRSIEESDPTVPGKTEVHRSILPDVPDDAAHSFDSETAVEHDTVLPTFHRKAKSTAETLWDLTKNLRDMQAHQDFSVHSKIESYTEDSDAEAFVNSAAAVLMKRTKAKKADHATHNRSDNTETPEQKYTAAENWSKLRKGVRLNAISNELKKKEDSALDLETGESPQSSVNDRENSNGRETTKHSRVAKTKDKIKSEFHDFEEWLRFRRVGMYQYLKTVLFYLIIPATGIAAILFYLTNNPPCGTVEECQAAANIRNSTQIAQAANSTGTETNTAKLENFFSARAVQASVAWWLLFLGVRQVITLTLAKITQALLIDFLALRTRLTVKLFGPFVTLFVVQAKGWPFLCFFWCIYDFALLYGNHPFPKHWLFWQDYINLFNEENPAGEVTSSDNYRKLLALGVCVGVVVAAKRFWLGLFLGRQAFHRYAEDLAKIMRKALLIGEIATFAREMEKYNLHVNDFDLDRDVYRSTMSRAAAEETSMASGTSPKSSKGLGDKSTSSAFRDQSVFSSKADITGSQRVRLDELLGAWEEPEEAQKKNERVNISSVIQFRQSLNCLDTPLPFSVSFGPAATRQQCIASTEKVYHRLLLSSPGRSVLSFDTLALNAIRPDGRFDEEKLKEIIRIFRPDREGNLTLLDFAKSVDCVYKELRLLRASVASSSKMDHAFGKIINIVFYTILGCIVLAVVGIDPFVLFASISGFLLGFAFMIGAACSKYFEGLLFILIRRPYDIGDRIHVSDVNSETSTSGSTTWFVRDVTLFYTTVVLAATNELATYSNGSLASSRIINAARSPQAVQFFLLKFPIDVSYEKLKVFRNALEKFVKARPREWLSFSAFRVTRVEADQGFVECIVVAVHRESWQNIGALLDSKAELTSFALELSKKMGLRYRSPPMPVDLTVNNGSASIVPQGTFDSQHVPEDFSQGSGHVGSFDIASLTNMFDDKTK